MSFATEICPRCFCYTYRCHFGSYWICLNCNHSEGQAPGFTTSQREETSDD